MIIFFSVITLGTLDSRPSVPNPPCFLLMALFNYVLSFFLCLLLVPYLFISPCV